jgi:lipopolysaccharide/colanic/teichoic acid biosynthesis glycosyltransferase
MLRGNAASNVDAYVARRPMPGKRLRTVDAPMPLVLGAGRRIFDIVGSLTLLLVLLPLLAGIAVAVKLTSRGPVFYLQTRVGMNRRTSRDQRRAPSSVSTPERRRGDRRVIASAGKLFRICKFRSMVDGAENAVGATWAVPDDPRITPVGRILRKTRLDELPQLVNVLRGEMSFIGPRPERPFFVEKFCLSMPTYTGRLVTPPGITGLAQVEHKYDTSYEDVRLKLEYDLRYLQNRSVRMDLLIFLKTIKVMLSGSGAH